MMKPITVLLADDHRIVRDGVKKLLEAERDIEVVGEATNGREAAVAMTRKLHPAVILMDISMPRLNGLEATRQIRQAVPATKVLMFSVYSDDAYVESAMAAGASGYLIKQTSALFLSAAIREVHKGRTFFSPSLVGPHRSHPRTKLELKDCSTTQDKRLTSSEVEVLKLMADGAVNKQIAADLGISVKTVEKHRDQLRHKLDIHDIAGLTRYAIAAGLIEGSVQLTII